VSKKEIIYFLSAFLLLLISSSLRPLNADEGYYMLTAAKVLNGEFPYIDFRFHHLPLMIYVYSFVSDLGIWSMVLGRLISVFLILFSAYLLYKFLLTKADDLFVSRLFLFFFFLNAFFIDWAVTIKIYAVSSLLLAVAVITFSQGKMFWSGLFIGLLFLSRIVFAVNVIIFIIFSIYLVTRKGVSSEPGYPGGRYRTILVSLAGLSIPLLIFILFFRNELASVYSNVIEEPMMIKKFVQVSYFQNIFKLLLFFLLPQNLLLTAVILISGFKYSLFEKFLALNVIGFLLIHIPTQMLPEYLSSITPIFVLLAVLRYTKFEVRLPAFRRRAIMITYAILIPLSIAHLKHLIEQRPVMPTPIEMFGFCNRINSLGGNTMLSSWEGFPVFCGIPSVHTERYLPVYDQIRGDTAAARKFKLTSPDDSKSYIANLIPDLIIYDREEPRSLDGLKDLIDIKYKQAFMFKSQVVYKKP
jgi:hypothetical protein